MKENRSLILNIPGPCTQSWDDMNAVEGGRFCRHCQKKVIDFSGMSDQEIRAALDNTNGQLCGRFDITQLRREITLPAEPKRSWLPAAMFASLMTVLIPENSRAGSTPGTVRQSVIRSEDHTIRVTARGFVEGSIIDGHTNEGLTGVTVYLTESKGQVGTATDQTGRFRLHLPMQYRDRPLHLKISYVGYESKDVCIDIDQLAMPLVILLRQETLSLKEVTVGTSYVTKKRHLIVGAISTISTQEIHQLNWWQRFKRLFKRSPRNP